MKIPDYLEPWCEDCRYMNLELKEAMFYADNSPVEELIPIGCKHRSACRAAVSKSHEFKISLALLARRFFGKKSMVPYE